MFFQNKNKNQSKKSQKKNKNQLEVSQGRTQGFQGRRDYWRGSGGIGEGGEVARRVDRHQRVINAMLRQCAMRRRQPGGDRRGTLKTLASARGWRLQGVGKREGHAAGANRLRDCSRAPRSHARRPPHLGASFFLRLSRARCAGAASLGAGTGQHGLRRVMFRWPACNLPYPPGSPINPSTPTHTTNSRGNLPYPPSPHSNLATDANKKDRPG